MTLHDDMAGPLDVDLPDPPPMDERVAAGELDATEVEDSKRTANIVMPHPGQPMAVAREVMAHLYIHDDVPTLLYWRGQWWKYNGTHWAVTTELHLRGQLYTLLENAYFMDGKDEEPVPRAWNPTPSRVTNVLDPMKSLCNEHVPDTLDAPVWIGAGYGHPAREYLPVRNGLLHLPTRTLENHTPALFTTFGLTFAYQPDATADEWEKFLNQVFAGDGASIELLQEWFGYGVAGRTDLQKILLLIGLSRSGKGTIARVLQHLVGTDNTAGPTLASMSTNFGLQTLIGRVLAIVADARLHPRDSRQVVERLLSISGEDMLTIDRKYAEPWTGTLGTRIMILSNELPRFGDASAAIVNRFVTLRTRKSFLGNEDPKLTSKLLAELSGILNWALDGLTRLNEQGTFTVPEAMADEMDTMRELASPLVSFVAEECEATGQVGDTVNVDVVYPRYHQWALDAGHTPMSKTQFYESLPNSVPEIRRSRPRNDDGSRPRLLQGMKLQPPRTGFGPAAK